MFYILVFCQIYICGWQTSHSIGHLFTHFLYCAAAFLFFLRYHSVRADPLDTGAFSHRGCEELTGHLQPSLFLLQLFKSQVLSHPQPRELPFLVSKSQTEKQPLSHCILTSSTHMSRNALEAIRRYSISI